ncbi:MAG: hypothetical protein R6V44_05980 [Paracoccaceae bacterium]
MPHPDDPPPPGAGALLAVLILGALASLAAGAILGARVASPEDAED